MIHTKFSIFIFVFSILILIQTQTEPLITDLYIVLGNSSNISCPEGFQKLDKDLNEGVGGDYIYLCYKKDPQGTAIRSISITTDNIPPNQFNFTPVIGNKDDLDLNAGVGHFDFLHTVVKMYYSKDPNITREIVELGWQDNPKPVGGDWFVIQTDLNQNTNPSHPIFLKYRFVTVQ